jgi:hypothetical protein
MAENLNLNVNINTTGAEGSIGSLKRQMREAQAEVIALSDKFGATSVQAVNAAKKAAELRDRIGDAKSLTDAFNPDAKFKALTASLSGVAGGFGAVQGAMALFGAESDNVQKTLLKVQSAMALSQGLQAVGESVDSFKQLGAVIRTQVVSAFSTLRGAIIATGVGALAVGLGLLIANFDKVKEVINNLFPSLGEFADRIKLIVQGFTDFIGLTSQVKRDAEAFKKTTTEAIDILDNRIKVLQSLNGKEEEIYNAKKERIEKELSLIKGATAEEIKTKKGLEADLIVLDNNEAARRKKKAEQEEADNLKLLEEGRARRKEIEDFDTQLQQRLMELDEEKANKKRELDFQRIQNLITDLDYEKGLKENDFQDDLQRLANKEAYIAELKSIELSNLDLSEKERIDIIAKYAKQEQDIDKEITATKKAEADARIEIQFAVTNAAGAAGRLLQSIAGENKKMAITGIILEQAAAIANIGINAKKNFVKDGGIKSPLAWLNLTAAGLAAASAVVSARKGIAAINSSSLSDSSGVSTGLPSMSTQAPMAPQLPMAQTTNLSQQTINDIGNQAVRAYVVESDITSSQERITAIRQRARFS